MHRRVGPCWLSLVVLIAGCDPEFLAIGDVVDGSGAPVQGAKISLVCDGAEQSWDVSDKIGRFKLSTIGRFGSGCSIEIKHERYGQLQADVMQNCIELSHDQCATVSLHARFR